MATSRYPFEETEYAKLGHDVQSNIDALDKRLGLSGNSLGTSNVKNKIKVLIAVYPGNIEWYQKRIKSERFRLRMYNVTSIILIILIPIIIYFFTQFYDCVNQLWLGKFCPGVKRSAEFYASFGVVVLTSLLGLHKAISSWIDKRQLLSVFHEASSALKSSFYSFEDLWNGKEIFITSTSTVTEAFDESVEKLITQGRKTANNERKKYFEAIESPSIELSNILSSSFTQASGLMKSFQSRRFTRKLEELEAEYNVEAETKKLKVEIREIQHHTTSLEEWLTDVKAELVKKPVDARLKQLGIDLEDKIVMLKKQLIAKQAQL